MVVFRFELGKNLLFTGTKRNHVALIRQSLQAAGGEPAGRARKNLLQQLDRMVRVLIMATDYDAPRKTEEDVSEESIEELKTRRTATTQSAVVDEDEAEAADSFELPGADLSGEELLVRVLPPQADEFTCASCFLVRHRSQIALEKDGLAYCTDCEG